MLKLGLYPNKGVTKNAEYMNFIKNADEFGFIINDYSIDFPKVIKRSRDVATKMSNGIGFLFKKFKVESIKGSAFIKSKNLVEVKDNSGEIIDSIECKNIIIATGARPRMFEGIDVDHKRL